MSKKNLLNEGTIKQFGKLANINATLTSNFIEENFAQTGLQEDEVDVLDDIAAEEDAEEAMADADALEDEADAMEDEAQDDLAAAEIGAADDAESLVMSIVGDIQQLAQLAGVEVDVESEEEIEIDDEIDIDGDIEDMDVDMDVEETLEEMIGGILGEETHDEKERRNIRNNEKHIARLRHDDEEDAGDMRNEGDKKGDPSKTRPGDEDYEAHEGSKSKTHPGEKDFTTKKGDKLKVGSGKWGSKPGDKAYVNERLVQEVLQRVKTRLASLSKSRK